MFLFRSLGLLSTTEYQMEQSQPRTLGDFIRRQSGTNKPINSRYLNVSNSDATPYTATANRSERRATILAQIGVTPNSKVNLRKISNFGRTECDDDWHHISNSDLDSDSESDSFDEDTPKRAHILSLQSQISELHNRIQTLENENRKLSGKIQTNVSRQTTSSHFIEAIKKFQKRSLNKVNLSKVESLDTTYVWIPKSHKLAAFNRELAKKVRNPSLRRVKHILESRKMVDPHKKFILKIEAEMNRTKTKLRRVHPSVPTVIVLE